MDEAQISPALGGPGGDAPAAPLQPGEELLRTGVGVRLGWQPQTILIWWLPGLLFIVVGWLEFRSVAVTAGMLGFCGLLFAFYAQDREVRPQGGGRHYMLTDRRLLIGAPGGAWRPVELSEVAATHMEEGIADRLVARLSGAATIVLEMRDPGPKGEPRRVRIGPLKRPRDFRRAIDAGLGAP